MRDIADCQLRFSSPDTSKEAHMTGHAHQEVRYSGCLHLKSQCRCIKTPDTPVSVRLDTTTPCHECLDALGVEAEDTQLITTQEEAMEAAGTSLLDQYQNRPDDQGVAFEPSHPIFSAPGAEVAANVAAIQKGKPKCAMCPYLIEKPGAIVFGPPMTLENGETVSKYHVCRTCYRKVTALFA